MSLSKIWNVVPARTSISVHCLDIQHTVCVLSQKWRKPRQSLSDEDLDAISCLYRTVSCFSGCGGCEGENLDSVYRAAIIPDKSVPHPSFSNQDLLSTNIQTIYFLGALEKVESFHFTLFAYFSLQQWVGVAGCDIARRGGTSWVFVGAPGWIEVAGLEGRGELVSLLPTSAPGNKKCVPTMSSSQLWVISGFLSEDPASYCLICQASLDKEKLSLKIGISLFVEVKNTRCLKD